MEQLCQLTIETLEKETQQHNYTLLYTVKNNLVEVPVQYQTVPNNNRVSCLSSLRQALKERLMSNPCQQEYTTNNMYDTKQRMTSTGLLSFQGPLLIETNEISCHQTLWK